MSHLAHASPHSSGYPPRHDRTHLAGCSLERKAKKIQVEAVTLRCMCGHSILCEVQPEGERIGFLAFFDDEPTSETYGHRVKSCPRCDEQLGLPLLYRVN
jgi:hypothetical protein